MPSNASESKPAGVRYLTAPELYAINDSVTDGEALIRDLHLLQSAVARPAISLFGEAQFPTVLDKAAALMHSLAYHHLFIDGNKRTAVRAVELFLEMNGYAVTWQFAGEYPFVLEIAQAKHDVPAIAAWLSGQVSRLA